ncbi:BglG family transcription antiterminator [Bacillus sp. EAC]|uniref:BglG family transcription antiterminator n=1 Tax=Bacillus sp. EAC TaxID=1978338 RepID=UPI000B450E7B|nr:BglG family transcription antiterminator [Bacillus sp. EAC]
MYISARERKILELLLNKQEEITVKEIADELTVSPRTVHRDLKGVEEIIDEYGLLLNKKSGSGVQLIGDVSLKEKIQSFLFNLNYYEYTSEERQTFILSTLLASKEPVKLVSLANDLNVTLATISNDLNKVDEEINPFNLKLLRKRGYGVEINGLESDKRKAMSKLINTNIEEYEFISIIKENIQKKSAESVNTRLLGLIDENKLLIIEKQINRIKKELPYAIADRAYIGLVVHLVLAIERIEQGEKINFDENLLVELKKSKEFNLAKKLAIVLEEIFNIEISDGEVGYITMHLMGAKLSNEHPEILEDSSLHVGVYAQNLIRFVSNELNRDLTKNVSLFKDLVAHLKPALYRIKQNMGISNPLLLKIEEDYQKLYFILTKAAQIVFNDLEVPKEEIGFLVIHFASAILSSDQVKEHKTLVVCSSGIGTSKILSTKLQKEIPGLKTVNISLFDLPKIDLSEYGTIISTIPLKNINEEYLLVNPLLSESEIAKIRKSIMTNKRLIGKGINENQDQIKVNHENFIVDLKKVKNYSTVIYKLLEGFYIDNIEQSETIADALQEICNVLKLKSVIKDPENVVSALLKREELGGIGIPGTSLGLYHTRSESILKPSFSIGRLNNAFKRKAMDDTDIEVDTILLMLSPSNISDEALEILSGISSLIIRDEQSIELFQTGNEEELLNLLATEMKELYDSKFIK